MLRILGTLFAVLMGLAFGSFLNVCLSRWPEGESVVQPRSYCRSCLRTLTWWENVPLLSWLALMGRCRSCKAWIGLRYPVVELAVGWTWGLLAWRLIGLLMEQRLDPVSKNALPFIQVETAIGTMIFCWVLVGLAVLDAEHFWLPDVITLPGIVTGVVFYVVVSAQMLPLQLGSFLMTEPAPRKAIVERILSAFAASGLIFLIRWIYSIFRHREGIGMGDVKLMAMLAAWLGLESALLSFAIGVVLGAFIALIVLSLPSTRRNPKGWAKTRLPLGTFLCIGGIVSALWGEQIIAEYLRWAGL